MGVIYQGERATDTIQVGNVMSVTTAGTALIERVIGGATVEKRAITSGVKIGPYATPMMVIVSAVNGDANMSQGATSAQATNRLSLATGSQDSSVVNRSTLQSAIDSGGVVYVDSPGDVYLSSPLYIGDDTQLILASGTQLKAKDGSLTSLIQTKAYLAAWSGVAIAWSSGKTATITWANHGLIEGDAVVLQGATLPTHSDWWDIFRVASVIDANTVTIRLPFVPTASPAGTITAKRCNRNIRLDVSIHHNYDNNSTTGQNLGRMASVLAFIADSHVVVRAQNVYKYVMLLAGAINVTGEAWGMPNSRSDTLKFYGPCRNVEIKSYGHASEDCTSVQALEPAAFLAYMPCQGNITNVTVRNAGAYMTTAGSGPFVVYSDDTYSISDILVRDSEMHAMAGTTPAFSVKNGNAFVPSVAKIKDVTLRNNVMSSTGAPAVRIDTKARCLRIDGGRIIPSDADNVRPVSIENGGVLNALIIENLDFESGGWPVASAGYFAQVNGGGICDMIVFRKCVFRGSSNLRVLLINASASCKHVVFEDCEAESIDVLCRVEQGATIAPTVVIRGGKYKGVMTGVNARMSLKVVIDGAPVFDGMSNGVARCELSGTAVELIGGDGAQYLNGSLPFVCLTSATMTPRGKMLPVDIGATGVTKAGGAECYNTAARGTIPANTRVLSDGTNWYNATNLSQTY